FFLVELHKEPLQSPIEIPVEIPKVVAVRIVAVIRELDRLSTRATAAFPFGGTFGAPGGEELELLEPAKKRRGEESGHGNPGTRPQIESVAIMVDPYGVRGQTKRDTALD